MANSSTHNNPEGHDAVVVSNRSREPISEAPSANGREPKEEVGWRRIIRNFTASWFSVVMGTGIVSILLHNLPYNTIWIQYISYGIFILNISLFTVFLAMTAARYALYPEIWPVMIRNPTQSLFLGCIPMAFATIINMTVLVCAPWGHWAVYLAWTFWWVDVVVSLVCCLTVPFVIVRLHNSQLENITAVLLLPVVPVVVASASGAIIAEVLPNLDHAVTTLIVSYVLWGLGQTFAFFILTTYFIRLQLHDLPPREAIVSVMLPLGPFGQGGFGILQLGKVSLDVFSKTSSFKSLEAVQLHGGEVLYVLGVVAALISWGAGLGWLSFALISIYSTKSFPFNIGWWGFTFPLGVFTTCTNLLAKELSSTFFSVTTMILSISVLLLWIMVGAKTMQLAVTGEMFHAPCLRDLRPKAAQTGGDRTA